MENADYLTTHKDYSESVDALERAIATLKKQAYDRTQLLQVSQLNLIPEHAKKVRLGLVVKSYKTRLAEKDLSRFGKGFGKEQHINEELFFHVLSIEKTGVLV